MHTYTSNVFLSSSSDLVTPDLGGSGSTLSVLYAISASLTHSKGTRNSLCVMGVLCLHMCGCVCVRAPRGREGNF